MTRHGIATEKFSHLVIVGPTLTMLLDGDDDVEMTNDRCDWTSAGGESFPAFRVSHQSASTSDEVDLRV